MLKQIFNTAPAASKNTAQFKSGQKRLKNKNRALCYLPLHQGRDVIYERPYRPWQHTITRDYCFLLYIFSLMNVVVAKTIQLCSTDITPVDPIKLFFLRFFFFGVKLDRFTIN